MAILIFPGRHLLHTRFQEKYLKEHLQVPVEGLPLLGECRCSGVIDEVIFAITSANQSHSRYNPLPLEVRAVGIDRLARGLRASHPVRCRIIPIPHYGPTARFAEFLLKEISEATEGERTLTPENSLVLTSTPELIDQFIQLGFGVLPGELLSRIPPRFAAETPIEVLKRAVAVGDSWHLDDSVRQTVSSATWSVWQDFPEVLRRVVRLYRDPLLTEQGGLTAMRNYVAYAAGMGNQSILDAKFQDIREAIVPGRIVDEGCADGALLVPVARDFPDSDLIGIEITGEFMARCNERQRATEYGGTYIHFHQRNIAEPIFLPASIDTTICNSTTHELWSYGRQETTLRAYLAEKYRQTRKGGRLVIRDVVGPEQGDQDVFLWCNSEDGRNDEIYARFSSTEELAAHLADLSTAARFERFAEDFLAIRRSLPSAGAKLPYTPVTIEARRLFKLTLRNAMEFLLKKDYASNWASELQEEFAFWSFSDWKRAVVDAGFRVMEDPNHPMKGSRAYTSRWIAEHRFIGRTELYRLQSPLARLEYPVTNMVLVAEK